MVTQVISPIDLVLHRSDVLNTDESKDAFVTSVETFTDAIPPLATELNALASQVNSTATDINALEQSAQSAADIATAMANFDGTWLVGKSYTVPVAVWLAGRYYSALAPSTGQTPPNATYWALIPGIDDSTPASDSSYSGAKTQELHDAQAEAIANLASASGSIANTATPVFDPVTTTPTDLPFTVVVPSTNSAVFTFDDSANTMTFLKDGSFNYNSNVEFGASTTDARVVTFDIIDTTVVTAGSFVVGKTYSIVSVGTTDFTLIGASANTVGVSFEATGVGSGTGTAMVILGSQLFNINIAAGSTITIPSNTLLTVGSNGIPSAPLTVKVQVKVDAGATVDLISFNSTLITNSVVNEAALAEAIHSAPSKATPVAADEFGFLDSADGFSLAKIPYETLAQKMVSTDNVLLASASLTAGAVGTVAFLRTATSVVVSAGTNYAGSGLNFAAQAGGTTGASGTPSGTWKALGSSSATASNWTTVFIRIA